MSIEKLKVQIKNKEFENIYLFFGEEVLLKEYYLNKLKEKILNPSLESFNYYMFSERNINLSNIADALESFPVMSDKKLIYIKDSDIFKSPKAGDIEFWEDSLKNIPSYVCLIFDENNIDKRGKLYKFVNKNGFTLEFEKQKTNDTVNWVGRLFATYGKKISLEDIHYLLLHCNEGMINIKNEIIKLSSYCYDREHIIKDDIDKVCTKSIESKVFGLMDSLMEKDTEKAMQFLSEMKILKEPVVKILSIMAAQFSKILTTKLLLDKGYLNDEILKRIKVAPFVLKKYIKYSHSFSKESLIKIIKDSAETDNNIKMGKIKEWIALEVLVLSIVRF
jgi:DNA polymerase-3 subunit delta